VLLIPAVDLREGACVQLVGGSYDDERVRLDDPLEVARGWARAGFRRLHVVDLDAATGRGSNAEVIRTILAEPSIEAEVGGGVRSAEHIRRLLDQGARHVVVGTRAIEEPAWLDTVASEFPRRLIVAADVSGRTVVTRGWAESAGRDVLDVLETLEALPLAGVLVTAVHREGRLEGADLTLMRELAAGSRLPLFASGGITTMDELRSLAGIGIHAAILGMAIYTGALEPRALIEEFSA
jgi:phosphoribosylformimino-5-aminoimidazole carboxamide ribotide isomerase